MRLTGLATRNPAPRLPSFCPSRSLSVLLQRVAFACAVAAMPVLFFSRRTDLAGLRHMTPLASGRPSWILGRLSEAMRSLPLFLCQSLENLQSHPGVSFSHLQPQCCSQFLLHAWGPLAAHAHARARWLTVPGPESQLRSRRDGWAVPALIPPYPHPLE